MLTNLKSVNLNFNSRKLISLYALSLAKYILALSDKL